MPLQAASRRRFLDRYRSNYERYRGQANLLEKFIADVLRDSRIDIHKIEARAKAPDSVQLKLLRKRYKRPRTQLTDAVAGRIITYYPSDVDRVVDVLRGELEVDRRHSVDKRRALGTRAFGYSSVHLVARLKGKNLKKPEYSSLSGLRFEIQVRSILEHAWAEIEHEVVFKSGVSYPEEIDRKFAALAGSLEILGGVFVALKGERNDLIEKYRRDYACGVDFHRPFDAARLLGFMEFAFPGGASWRVAEGNRRPFPPRIEATCVAALRECHLSTGDALYTFVRSRGFRRAIKAYAGTLLVDPAGVSHLAVLLVAIALRNSRVLGEYFPEMSQDSGLRALTITASRRPYT
jgi:ppGpp synthetase/RelA/SpoT-type nucleotidyltranferase